MSNNTLVNLDSRSNKGTQWVPYIKNENAVRSLIASVIENHLENMPPQEAVLEYFTTSSTKPTTRRTVNTYVEHFYIIAVNTTEQSPDMSLILKGCSSKESTFVTHIQLHSDYIHGLALLSFHSYNSILNIEKGLQFPSNDQKPKR